jgi:hypothetical protein
MKSGIHNISDADYFADAAISNSDLKWIVPPYAAAHFRAFKNGEMERAETDALTIGRITHACLLEPDKLAGSFVIKPEGMSFATKEGKAWKEENAGREIISEKASAMIARMIESVWQNKTARTLLKNSDRELAYFAEEDGVNLRAKIDAMPKTGSAIVDLKTCDLADLDSVESSIFKYGYYRQAAFYRRVARLLGIDRPDFLFLFVEKTPPHCVAIYKLGDVAMEAGDAEIEAALTTIRSCQESGIWPGRDADINEASIPDWALKQMGNQF